MHAQCARQARACVHCAKLLHRCCPRTWPAHDPGAMQRQANTFLTLHSARFTPCTSHFTLALRTRHFISPQIRELFSPHLIPSLLTCHLSKFFSTVFISSGHDQPFSSPRSSSQLIVAVLHARKLLLSERSLLRKKNIGRRKFLHTDTWDTDAFRQKSLSEILCTTKLAQSTSQYYFVLQSLHKARTSQYYFVLQGLHKALPSTTLSKEVWKSNFRQYGQMNSRGGKSQRREEKSSKEKIREEKESEERRCRCTKR